MHLYQAQFEGEWEYFNAKDCWDIEIQSQSIWKQCTEDQYHNAHTLEREVEDLQEIIWELEQQLEQAISTHPLEHKPNIFDLTRVPPPNLRLLLGQTAPATINPNMDWPGTHCCLTTILDDGLGHADVRPASTSMN
jgi:hypothetical protein